MNEPQNSAGVAKLFAPPFKTYVESAEKDKKTGKIIKTRFTCWLHPLTDKEQLSVEAVAAENLRAAVKEQLNDNDCWYRRNRAYICQRLFYSVRTGSVADRPGVPGLKCSVSRAMWNCWRRERIVVTTEAPTLIPILRTKLLSPETASVRSCGTPK